jgi:hypothetical protein
MKEPITPASSRSDGRMSVSEREACRRAPRLPGTTRGHGVLCNGGNARSRRKRRRRAALKHLCSPDRLESKDHPFFGNVSRSSRARIASGAIRQLVVQVLRKLITRLVGAVLQRSLRPSRAEISEAGRSYLESSTTATRRLPRSLRRRRDANREKVRSPRAGIVRAGRVLRRL